jgi:hypothetical protein
MFPPGPETALGSPAISCISEALKLNISLIRLLPKNEPVIEFGELKISKTFKCIQADISLVSDQATN